MFNCIFHKIKKGRHRTNRPKLGLHWKKNKIVYEVVFNFDCRYETEDKKNQLDINKLFGLSFGLHHKNSARFGWRDNGEGKIDILAYVYRNGKRVTESEGIYIETVEVGRTYTMDITVTNDVYMFTIIKGSKLVGATIVDHGDLLPIGYYLNPYFGGDEKAPHDMVIELCRVI
jgi:hypothetical protein